MRKIFIYKKLGNFTYYLVKNKNNLKPFLLKWIGKEWQRDHEEFPDQTWTTEWLNLVPNMKFKLVIINLDDIKLRSNLMNYQKDGYNFLEELTLRAEEMEESVLRGSSIEPLIVNNNGMELLDGYTRYKILKKNRQKKTYVYLGSIK